VIYLPEKNTELIGTRNTWVTEECFLNRGVLKFSVVKAYLHCYTWKQSQGYGGSYILKGTHAWDFQSLLQNFFGTFQSLTDTKQSTDNQHFRKISFEFAQIFQICYYSLLSPKACSMNKRCRWKLGVKFSIVFATVRFRIVLSVFGQKVESNFAFLMKARS
jgi:hypothetical protein